MFVPSCHTVVNCVFAFVFHYRSVGGRKSAGVRGEGAGEDVRQLVSQLVHINHNDDDDETVECSYKHCSTLPVMFFEWRLNEKTAVLA